MPPKTKATAEQVKAEVVERAENNGFVYTDIQTTTRRHRWNKQNRKGGYTK